jgi:hypothetical protein
MIPGNPLIWVCVVLGLALPSVYGAMKVRNSMEVRAAYDKGVEAGKGAASTAALEEAKKAAGQWNAAQAETPVDADREYFRRLCATHSSCALRSKYRERGQK